MNLIPVKTPKLIKGIFPKYVWNMPQDQKVIYLTFDDGPTPEITNWTLDLLKSYNAKATFFCIGNNIEKHPEIFHDILKEGHAVGNHTFHHAKGWTTNSDKYIDEVLKTEQVMSSEFRVQSENAVKKSSPRPHQKGTFGQVIAHQSKLFRPPYGQITTEQGRRLLALDYKIIMWDILAFDWKDSVSEEETAQNVISKAGPGSIVVLHDSVKASPRMKFALTKILEHFSKEGFVFESIA